MERAHLQKTVVLLVSLLSLSSASAAQWVTRLPSLSQLLSEDLSTTIVGIDYRGEAEKSPTLFFATKGTEVDWDHLRAAPGLEISDWGNRYRRLTFTVTVEDMKQFIEAVKTIVIPNQETEPWLSLMVVAGSGPQQKTFLGSVSRQKAGEFFILTRNALRADPKDISIMNGKAIIDDLEFLYDFRRQFRATRTRVLVVVVQAIDGEVVAPRSQATESEATASKWRRTARAGGYR
jgi:hypothetical protein